MDARGARAIPVLALLATSIGSGAAVGLTAACFVWLVDRATELVWIELPERFEVAPFDSWWIVAVPVVGGAVVGVLHRVLGDHPRPMEEAVATWRSGGHLDPAIAPKTAIIAVVVLAAGGPVGFEAALVGVLGGTAAVVAPRIGAAGRLVRQAWGGQGSPPAGVRRAPYWLAGVTSVLVYRWVPFGAIDLGFRFDRFDREWTVGEALAVFVFAAVATVPIVAALRVVVWAEHADRFMRAPVAAGVAGGLAIAVLAWGHEDVLFSGQVQFQGLPGLGTGALLYITVAKWVALVIALATGWRGGPIFPMYVAVGAAAVVVADVIDVSSDLIVIAALAAVGTVITKGDIGLAAVLTVYVVPLSYLAVIVLGCLGTAVALMVLRAARAPAGPAPVPPDRMAR